MMYSKNLKFGDAVAIRSGKFIRTSNKSKTVGVFSGREYYHVHVMLSDGSMLKQIVDIPCGIRVKGPALMNPKPQKGKQ